MMCQCERFCLIYIPETRLRLKTKQRAMQRQQRKPDVVLRLITAVRLVLCSVPTGNSTSESVTLEWYLAFIKISFFSMPLDHRSFTGDGELEQNTTTATTRKSTNENFHEQSNVCEHILIIHKDFAIA